MSSTQTIISKNDSHHHQLQLSRSLIKCDTTKISGCSPHRKINKQCPDERKSRTRSSSRCCCLPVPSISPPRFRSVSPKKLIANNYNNSNSNNNGNNYNNVVSGKKETTVKDDSDTSQSAKIRVKTKPVVSAANIVNIGNDNGSNNMRVEACDQNVAQLCNKMQLLRFENSAKCCRRLLKHNGHSNKVYLYPEESWARNASTSYWTLVPFWWNCGRCKIIEIVGTKRYTTYAKMSDTDNGNLHIHGSFKKCPDPDFKLTLTSNVSLADFNLGYCMVGSLERGCRKLNNFQTTHFAVIKRAEFNKQ